MRLIDIDALPDDCAWCCDALIEAINDAPAIDAVEVVRCKDCIWYLKDGSCARHLKQFESYDFCSYGKRKDGEQK